MAIGVTKLAITIKQAIPLRIGKATSFLLWIRTCQLLRASAKLLAMRSNTVWFSLHRGELFCGRELYQQGALYRAEEAIPAKNDFFAPPSHPFPSLPSPQPALLSSCRGQ